MSESWHEPDHPLWSRFVDKHCEHFLIWRFWKEAFEATLEEFATHSVACPARHEADRRLTED